MTDALSPGTTGDGRPSASFVVDPSRTRRWVRGLTAVTLLAIVLAGGCVAYARVASPSDQIETLLGIAAGVAAAIALACVVALVVIGARRRVGDDAIDLVVTEQGLVGPGGLGIPWHEVAGVEMSTSTPVTAQGTRDTGRASAVVRLVLTDPRSTLERSTTPLQAGAVRTGDGAPHVRVDLTDRAAGEVAHLRDVLDAELAPRGQRVREIAG